MIVSFSFIFVTFIALIIVLPCIGVTYGQSLIAYAAQQAINEQPRAQRDIKTTMLFAMATVEFGALIGLFISFMLLISMDSIIGDFYKVMAVFAIVLATCLTAPLVSYFSALPAQTICNAIARQPLHGTEYFRFMLVVTSIMQSPIILGLIISLIIRQQILSLTHPHDIVRLIAAGFTIGFGSIGPLRGLAQYAQQAAQEIGRHYQHYREILTFSLITQAIIETPNLFAMIISIVMLLIATPIYTFTFVRSVQYIACALCITCATFVCGQSLGSIGVSAVSQASIIGVHWNVLTRLSMLAQALVETIALYAAIISIIMLRT